MARPISIIEITEEERTELERRLKAHTTPQRDSLRAAIVLKRAAGMKQVGVASELAASVGISPDSVHRIRRENDLKPHLRRTFKASTGKEFERKFRDVIGCT